MNIRKVSAVVVIVSVVMALSCAAFADTPKEGEKPVPKQEVDPLFESLKSADGEKLADVRRQILSKGETAIEPLMKMSGSEDKAAAERARSLLTEIGVVDGLYVKIDMFRKEYKSDYRVGLRFVFRNYGDKPVSVFSPSKEMEPGYGFNLVLKNKRTGKAAATIDMNANLDPRLRPDNFIVIKPGGYFEDVVDIKKVFRQAVFSDEYEIVGKYSGKTPITDKIVADAEKLNIQNFFTREIVLFPFNFAIREETAPEPDDKTRQQIEQWIKELGANKYKVRRAAEKNLEKTGKIAKPFLKKAQKDSDIQIRETATKLLNKLTEPQARMATFLGITMRQDITKPTGIHIQTIAPKSAAERGRLEAGDIIIKISGIQIPGASNKAQTDYLKKQIMFRRKGDIIKLTVTRKGKQINLDIPLGETPARNIR